MKKGRWIPKVDDVEEVKAKGNLLYNAGKKFFEIIKDINVIRLRDKTNRVYGYEFKDYVLVAKRYAMGWIVSCHFSAVELCVAKNKQLVMYIEKGDKFYRFNAKNIIKEGTINQRGSINMLNFDIRTGINIEKIEEEQQTLQ